MRDMIDSLRVLAHALQDAWDSYRSYVHVQRSLRQRGLRAHTGFCEGCDGWVVKALESGEAFTPGTDPIYCGICD